MAAPMPEPAPVTRAVRPVRSNVCVIAPPYCLGPATLGPGPGERKGLSTLGPPGERWKRTLLKKSPNIY
jgi:hypothetical protein